MDDDLRRAAEMHAAVIAPGLDLLELLHGPRRSSLAERLLIAISGQESGDWRTRVQRSRTQNGVWYDGPARGLWQFERGGGVSGVLAHKATADMARRLCADRGVRPVSADVHERLAKDDLLACGFARLLLWTDPKPLPTDQDSAWLCYLRNWRPGKPDQTRWPRNWRVANRVLGITT